jgi:hypothetical protein
LESSAILLSQLIVLLFFGANCLFHCSNQVVVNLYYYLISLHGGSKVLRSSLLLELFNFRPNFVGNVFGAIDTLECLREAIAFEEVLKLLVLGLDLGKLILNN